MKYETSFLETICKFYNDFLNTILSSKQAIHIGNLALFLHVGD